MAVCGLCVPLSLSLTLGPIVSIAKRHDTSQMEVLSLRRVFSIHSFFQLITLDTISLCGPTVMATLSVFIVSILLSLRLSSNHVPVTFLLFLFSSSSLFRTVSLSTHASFFFSLQSSSSFNLVSLFSLFSLYHLSQPSSFWMPPTSRMTPSQSLIASFTLNSSRRYL